MAKKKKMVEYIVVFKTRAVGTSHPMDFPRFLYYYSKEVIG